MIDDQNFYCLLPRFQFQPELVLVTAVKILTSVGPVRGVSHAALGREDKAQIVSSGNAGLVEYRAIIDTAGDRAEDGADIGFGAGHDIVGSEKPIIGRRVCEASDALGFNFSPFFETTSA